MLETFTRDELSRFFRLLFRQCGERELCKTNIEAITNQWAETDNASSIGQIASIVQCEYHAMQLQEQVDID